ncbi:MAG TPA: RNA 2',3'-cyclic phosphodiesterase [Gemmatirosa sp.]
MTAEGQTEGAPPVGAPPVGAPTSGSLAPESSTVGDAPGSLRLFVALTPPAAAARALAAAAEPIVAACHGSARAVAAGAVHLTLRFLGDTPPARVPTLRDGLAAAAAAGAPLTLAVAGAGAFPTLARAQVLWLGLAPDAALDALAHRVDDACAAAGAGREARPFRAHLTVARLRRGARVDRDALGPALAAVQAPNPFVVATLDLVASTLTRAGARHDVLARFPLGTGAPELAG